ncbi:MAG: DUF362 domain-containing protein [Spirochaetes bacterium]|nr:DUF362 domain-containing protein [Spirochaetota bacterium]
MHTISTLREHITGRTPRRHFLRGFALAALGALPLVRWLLPAAFARDKALAPRRKRRVDTLCDLAVVKGQSPGAITRRAVQALGGMGRFVKKGDTVVIKPNIGWNRAPEYAATTNPEVVAALVRLCFEAGAARVRVFDRTCNDAAMSYARSGISAAAKAAGASVSYVSDARFIPGAFPKESEMGSWPIYRDAVHCDCFINVPVAKNHGLTKLTLSMKNLMGVCGGNRGQIHWNIDAKLPELTEFINPDLTVIDAYRILLNRGPSGGNLGDVKSVKTVIAGTDPVLADSYAATLFGIRPGDIGHIRAAEGRGLGTTDIARSRVTRITV